MCVSSCIFIQHTAKSGSLIIKVSIYFCIMCKNRNCLCLKILNGNGKVPEYPLPPFFFFFKFSVFRCSVVYRLCVFPALLRDARLHTDVQDPEMEARNVVSQASPAKLDYLGHIKRDKKISQATSSCLSTHLCIHVFLCKILFSTYPCQAQY